MEDGNVTCRSQSPTQGLEYQQMIRKWIYAREIACSQKDTNRRVLPFEWGLEWIDGTDLPLSLAPRDYLQAYVTEVLNQSDRFYTPSPVKEYTLQGNELTFPSPIQTPDKVNNTVYARFFPVNSQGKAVIVIPQWNADSESHVGLCRLLNYFGLTALRLTLPYHEKRKPAHLPRADYLVSPNIGRTIQACRQAVLEVRLAANWLEQQGYSYLGVTGTSIGSCIAFLAFSHDPRLRVGAFNHVSSYFADVVWTGITTQHVRKGLEGYVSLPELRTFWSIISPLPFVHRLQGLGKAGLLISARYDLTFLPYLAQQLFEEYHRLSIPYDKFFLPCGHYTSGAFPFKYLDGWIIARYLRKNLTYLTKC